MVKSDKVFVDSNYFIALHNAKDSLHDKALSIAKKLEGSNFRLVISNFVFLETVTVISQQAGKKVANNFGFDLLDSPIVEMIHINKTLQDHTWDIFQSISKKNMGFIDCSILAVMKQEKINKLLTFDKTDFSSQRDQYSFSIF